MDECRCLPGPPPPPSRARAYSRSGVRAQQSCVRGVVGVIGSRASASDAGGSHCRRRGQPWHGRMCSSSLGALRATPRRSECCSIRPSACICAERRQPGTTCASMPRVTIVGTRTPTAYGLAAAAALAEAFADAGVAVLSGLAYGVDARAHETTLASDGVTVAVLGSGPRRTLSHETSTPHETRGRERRGHQRVASRDPSGSLALSTPESGFLRLSAMRSSWFRRARRAEPP